MMEMVVRGMIDKVDYQIKVIVGLYFYGYGDDNLLVIIVIN